MSGTTTQPAPQRWKIEASPSIKFSFLLATGKYVTVAMSPEDFQEFTRDCVALSTATITQPGAAVEASQNGEAGS